MSVDLAARCCSLCHSAADAALGPFMPVQIQNGQLEWVHRDCALWSPEVSVDVAGRLVSHAAGWLAGLLAAGLLASFHCLALPKLGRVTAAAALTV
jgi:hypothetical protein